MANQLEELDNAAQRAAAMEVEAAIEGGGCAVDDDGRERILNLWQQVRKRAAKLTRPETLQKLQAEMQKAAVGEPDTLPRLNVPSIATPLSLWDWKV